MLVKLQNALDEVEIGKKNEFSLAKRIEELSMKISEMETELHDVLAEKRELGNAYDSIKTELECTALSLDCCKEEKNKVEASFEECDGERSRIRTELELVKRLLGNMALTENAQSRDNNEHVAPEVNSTGRILRDGQDLLFGSQDSEICQSEPEGEAYSADARSIMEPSNESRKLTVVMNQFQNELERLKSENLSPLLQLDVDVIDPSLNGLERAVSQLDQANEHLGSMYPSFKEFAGSGNALERVLALELELAESLQAKKKTDVRFESSFLKQHGDEAAVFQSFRDINELIQDMIELKKRYFVVESELKDMQGRYSSLSLQLAEVEGERQKLMMTVRSPRKS